jgi:transcriptional regulator with XRE-family HTH domain
VFSFLEGIIMGRRDKQISPGDMTTLSMGTVLRKARQQKGISLTEMAQRLHYTKGYLSGVENDKEGTSEKLVLGYEEELGLRPGELSESFQVQRATGLFSLDTVIMFLVKSASDWLDVLSNTLLNKKRIYTRDIRHLELALKNAVERGLTKIYSAAEREEYYRILVALSELTSHGQVLRREAIHFFSLSGTSRLEQLSEIYDRLTKTYNNLTGSVLPVEKNVGVYLTGFLEALLAELYSDPFFHDRVSNALKVHLPISIYQTPAEIITILDRAGKTIEGDYTVKQFQHDITTYTAFLERIHQRLKLVGIVPKDRLIDPELNGLFVPLRISFEEQTSHREHVSITTLLERHPYVVLLGDPGSGKSTVTRSLAWSHANALVSTPIYSESLPNAPLLPGMPVPLRIELRRLTEERRYHPDYSLLSYATEVWLRREGIEIHPQMFKALLERKAMILLLDGLDEVRTLEERQRLVEEIEEIAERYPGNRILVTSRPIGYELARFSHEGFIHARIEDFGDEQIHQFLERWYTYVLILSPLPYHEQQELEMLYKTLTEDRRLHALAARPLLLTVFTALNRYERLPDRRILIYDRCADLLLDTWAKLKGTDARWADMKMGKEDQYICIAQLGFALHNHSQSAVPARFILRVIEDFLRSNHLIAEVAVQRAEARRFLEMIQIEAGLIVERGINENGEALYGFVHLAFQEYFAASHIYDRYLQEDDSTIINAFLKEHLYEPHWHEVILLLLGKLKRKPATVQLRRILEGEMKNERSQSSDIGQQHLFFVSSCLIEEVVVESDLAELVVSRLGNLLKTPNVSSLRMKALDALVSLKHTHQYSDIARKELMALATQDLISDIPMRIRTAQILYKDSFPDSDERKEVEQHLMYLAQRHNLSFSKLIQDAEKL